MTFNINRNKTGDAQSFRTESGQVISRQEKIFIPDIGMFVTCIPYDDHFIYESNTPGPAHLCTCGSQAAIVPPGGSGMLTCLFHATNGYHQTTVVNKRNFTERYAGRTIEIAGKRTRIK